MVEQNPKAVFALASDRPWNRDLATRLEHRTKHHFTLIDQREELSLTRLGDIKPQTIFFPHWSSRIPREIHENFECIMFHMTDLPYGRGGSPLQNLIARGHRETVMTAFRCVEEMDAGPVYLKMPFGLDGPAREIYQRANELIEEMIVRIIRDKPEPVEQAGEVVEFCRRRPEDGDLASLQALEKVYDYIRMLDADGYPSAFLETEGFRLEFLSATANQDELTAEVRITLRQDDQSMEKS
jgi:methionyl-tRNA formyltransferase